MESPSQSGSDLSLKRVGPESMEIAVADREVGPDLPPVAEPGVVVRPESRLLVRSKPAEQPGLARASPGGWARKWAHRLLATRPATSVLRQ